MIPVPPLADEFCRGHVWRSLTINPRFRTENELLNFVRKSGLCAEQSLPSLVLEAIPDVCGIDRIQYLRLHSLMPFTCFIDAATSDGEYLGAWLPRQVKFVAGVSPRRAAYVCRRCIEEDNGFWHVTYWRRTHQLPGVHECTKHANEPLCAVLDKNPFSRSPQQWICEGKAKPQPAADLLRSHRMVRRFVEICEAMLDGGRCWHPDNIRPALRRRAVNLGISVTARCRAARLHDLARDQFPEPFLAEVFPTFRSRQSDNFCITIDSAVMSMRTTASSLALAMTLLYGSNEEALSSWRRAGVLVRSTYESHVNVSA